MKTCAQCGVQGTGTQDLFGQSDFVTWYSNKKEETYCLRCYTHGRIQRPAPEHVLNSPVNMGGGNEPVEM